MTTNWQGFCILFLILCTPCLCAAADVVLAWDPNSESDLAGYKVYLGTRSGVYGSGPNPTPIVTLGKVTTYTVTGLLPGNTYYFAVTAYNTAGLESGYSNEVSTAITGIPCDLNRDGQVNVLDLQAVNAAILRGDQPATYDLNRDGAVNVLDVQILVAVILGTRACN